MNTKPRVVVSIAREELETVLRKDFADESRRLVKLHESAPDLLAMLERVCDALEDRLDRDDNSAALTEARALIAQVKGE